MALTHSSAPRPTEHRHSGRGGRERGREREGGRFHPRSLRTMWSYGRRGVCVCMCLLCVSFDMLAPSRVHTRRSTRCPRPRACFVRRSDVVSRWRKREPLLPPPPPTWRPSPWQPPPPFLTFPSVFANSSSAAAGLLLLHVPFSSDLPHLRLTSPSRPGVLGNTTGSPS